MESAPIGAILKNRDGDMFVKTSTGQWNGPGVTVTDANIARNESEYDWDGIKMPQRFAESTEGIRLSTLAKPPEVLQGEIVASQVEAGQATQVDPSPVLAGDDIVLHGDNEFALASSAQRFDANLDALRVLKHLEETGQKADATQQRILSKYSGFGDSGFSGAFGGRNVDASWIARGNELRELTTTDQFNQIQQSRLDAFYTTPEVVGSMWSGLEHLGVNNLANPRILEPAAGSGRFLGLQPVELAAKSRRTAVELDEMSGKILENLYPNAAVFGGVGFENAPIPENSIDVAISNVPFGTSNVSDIKLGKKGKKFLTTQVHNYFFAKTMTKLRPGGVMAFVTSHGTLDNPSESGIKFRQWMADRGDLIGAYRLPKGAFKDTQVVTDVIYIRKRKADEAPGDQSWVNTTQVAIPGERYGTPYTAEKPINNYYIQHPEMLLGTASLSGSQYTGEEYALDPLPDKPLAQSMSEAVARLPKGAIDTTDPSLETNRSKRTLTRANARDNSFVLNPEGQLERVSGHTVVKADLGTDDAKAVITMLGIRDAARKVLDAQLREAEDVDLLPLQADLNAQYDAFVKKGGALNSRKNVTLMDDDPDAPFLRALERQKKVNGKTTTQWEKMDLFTQRVVKGTPNRQINNATDAMTVTLNESGTLDFDRMGALTGQTPEDVQKELAESGAIFNNPAGGWETADEYLSGNVRQKLATAAIATKSNRAFSANFVALKDVQPEELAPSQISARIGSPWIPEEDIDEFVRETLDVGFGRTRYFHRLETTGDWIRLTDGPIRTRQSISATYGVPGMEPGEIVDRLLNSKAITVNMTVLDAEGNEKRVKDPKASAAAQGKADLLNEKFREFIWEKSEARAERLAKLYNETFNNIRTREYDGSHQTFPGMSTKWERQLHKHQRDAIWRSVTDGTTLLAHEVGFGKTAVMVAAGMEMRRLGMAQKVVYVVPKATHPQFQQQFREIYPYAKVLAPSGSDFNSKNRPEMMARIATGDWDAVIMADTQFKMLPLLPETQMQLRRDELADLRTALEQEQELSGKKGGTAAKDLERKIKSAQGKMATLQAKLDEISDDTMFFEEMGIDQIFVDEADNFKNLSFATNMTRVKGIPNGQSERAWDMFGKVRHLQEKNGGRGVVFATGTPIANTIAENYTMMRYLQPGALEERGIQHFDAWARTFGDTTNDLEQTTTGDYRITPRFAKFNNIPELSTIWQEAADIRVTSEVDAITKLQPRLVDDQGNFGRKETMVAPKSEALGDFMKVLADRAGNLGNVDPSDDNMLKIANDARKASLDMRLVDATAKDDPLGKASLVAGKVADIYRRTTPDKGTQLIFLDIATPKAQIKIKEEGSAEEGETSLGNEDQLINDVYSDIKHKLIRNGVPEGQIEFIHSANTDAKKTALFRRVNAGETRVVLGSTGKMGVGVNVQERAAAIHHVDAPWRPRDIEQREGRIVRQGNKVYGPKIDDETREVLDPGPGVQIFNYVTEGSFDAFMWQAIETKGKAIKSLMRRNVTTREIDDIDSLTISASEAKALASGNPDVMRAVQLRNDVGRLELKKAAFVDGNLNAKTQLKNIPMELSFLEGEIKRLGELKELADKTEGAEFAMTVTGTDFTEREAAGDKLLAESGKLQMLEDKAIGKFRGFNLSIVDTPAGFEFHLENPANKIKQKSQPIQGLTAAGSVQRISNLLSNIDGKITREKDTMGKRQKDIQGFTDISNRQFEEQGRLQQLRDELTEIETRLRGDEDSDGIVEF